MQANVRLTLGQAVLPQTAVHDAIRVLLGATLIAACAQVRIPLPFTPVPLTGQTFAVLLMGALLGWRLGAISCGVYLLSGIAGLPVFSGGAAGWAVMTGVRGGYLIGFVVAAAVVGWFAERGWDRGKAFIIPLLLGEVAIYAFGLPWLAFFVGIDQAVPMGLAPFIPGDLLKMSAVALLMPSSWTALRYLRSSAFS